MTDLRELLGAKYDETIEKVTDAIAGDDTDYLGCGCCTFYDYDESVARTGEDGRRRMAAHVALAAVLPGLLADVWDEGFQAGYSDLMYHRRGTPNPYRPETIATDATGAPVTPAAPDAINPPPNPSAAVTEPHTTEGA